jgi:hypothetical protein
MGIEHLYLGKDVFRRLLGAVMKAEEVFSSVK